MSKRKKKGVFNEYRGLVRQEIQSYCRENAIKEEDFHFLSLYQWQNVYDKTLEGFAEYEWAAHNGLHWLNTSGTFKKSLVYAFDSRGKWEWIFKLPEIVGNADETVYILLEEGQLKSKFWIAEGKPAVIAELIYEGLVNDDYYIVDKKYQWMITENHHAVVAFVGEMFEDKLEVLRGLNLG